MKYFYAGLTSHSLIWPATSGRPNSWRKNGGKPNDDPVDFFAGMTYQLAMAQYECKGTKL